MPDLFLFLEVTLVIDVIWDASPSCSAEPAVWHVRQSTAINCEGLKVVQHGCICGLLGSNAEYQLSPRPLMKNRKKLFLLRTSTAGWLFGFLVSNIFPPLERGNQSRVEKRRLKSASQEAA